MPDYASELIDQKSTITNLEEAVNNPSSFQVNYVQNEASKVATLEAIITDLYAEIEALKNGQ